MGVGSFLDYSGENEPEGDEVDDSSKPSKWWENVLYILLGIVIWGRLFGVLSDNHQTIPP